jgi:flagella basal body P-ring formation protein FlgA
MKQATFTLALLVVLMASSAAIAAPLDRTILIEAVQRAAVRNLPETVVSVEVHDIVLRGRVDVPDGATVSVRIRADGDEDWVGRLAANAMVRVNGEELHVIPLTADVAAYIEVPVMRLPVARGTRIRSEHVSAGQREAGSLPSGVLRDFSSIIGRTARRDLGLNQVVRQTDLEKAVDARRNRTVTLLLQRGSLKIAAPGVLRKDAMVGDLVQALSVSTRTLVYGILVRPDLIVLPSTASASSAASAASAASTASTTSVVSISTPDPVAALAARPEQK